MDNFKDSLKKLKWDSIIISILSVVLGILAIAMPNSLGDVLCYIFGSILIVIGVTEIVRYFMVDRLFGGYSLFLGMILTIVGIFCLTSTSLVQGIITVLFGLFILIDSLNSLADSVICARMKVKGWVLMLVLSLITAVLGVVVMFGSFNIIMIIAGCSLILEGVRNLIVTLIFSRKVNTAKKEFKKLYDEKFIDVDVDVK